MSQRLLAFYRAEDVPVGYFVLAADGVSQPRRSCEDAPGFSCAAERGYTVVTWERSDLIHGVVAAEPEVATLFARQAHAASLPSGRRLTSTTKGKNLP